MTDNLRRSCDIPQALWRGYPAPPQGRIAQHLSTTAPLVSGITASRKCHQPAIATQVPHGHQRDSRIKGYERWLKNPKLDAATFSQPYLPALLGRLPPAPSGLVMDTSPLRAAVDRGVAGGVPLAGVPGRRGRAAGMGG